MPLFRQVNRRRWQQTTAGCYANIRIGAYAFTVANRRLYPASLAALAGFVFAYRFRARTNAEVIRDVSNNAAINSRCNNYFHSHVSQLSINEQRLKLLYDESLFWYLTSCLTFSFTSDSRLMFT